MKNKVSAGPIYAIVFGLFFLWIVLDVVFSSILIGSLVFLGVVFLLGLIVYAVDYVKNIGKKKEQRERQKLIADGKFEFPVLEFYDACNSSNCTDIESSFCLEKARLIADGLLEQNDVPPEYNYLYNSNEKIAEYMASGKKQKIEKEEEERKEQERIAKIPHAAKLNREEKETILVQNKVAELFGRDKRELMLQNAISVIEKKIKEINDAQNEALKIGAILSQSATREKTTDWAIAGGIASGIAGPAAGLAVAANTMQKNAEIEARNQQNQAAANKLASSVMSSLYASAGNTSSLSAQKNELVKELKKLPQKVVMRDTEQSKIIQSMKVVDYNIEETNSNALMISVQLKNDLIIKDVPADVCLTIDGSLKGEIYAGEMFVDAVTIPLPLFGVGCGQQEIAQALCAKYSKNGEPYTLKIQPNKLWVMEI